MGLNLRALLSGELPPIAEESDLGLEIPDFPPKEWGEPAGDEPSD